MTIRLISICAAAFALAGCKTLSSSALTTVTATTAPQVKHISYESMDVALSWSSSSATLNYDAELAVSNAEIEELVSSETGCTISGSGSPTLLGSRVTITIPINCSPSSSDADNEVSEA